MIGYFFVQDLPVMVDNIFMTYIKNTQDSLSCVFALNTSVDMEELTAKLKDVNFVFEDLTIYQNLEKTKVVWTKHGPYQLTNVAEHVNTTGIPERFMWKKVLDFVLLENQT